MRRLKKSFQNKPLFNVIVIYGTVAVGKFTVGNELHKLIKYKFFHNHHTHDLVVQLFDRSTLHLHRLIENIRFSVFKEIAEAKLNIITTHTYTSYYISKTGLTDPMYMKKVELIIEKRGGRACFVHLVASEKELLKRVRGDSRNNFKKLRDKKLMKEFLDRTECKIIAPVKNNLQIDNTNLSPKKVAQIIKKYFEL